MKFKMPVDFLNPRVQKTTSNERDDWFVPVGAEIKEEKDPTVYDFERGNNKAKKIIKVIALVIGLAIFIVLGYYFVKDIITAPVNPFKSPGLY